MNKEMIEKIKNDPNYQELISKRNGFAIKLTILMLSVYFAFILTIAFDPSVLGTPISEGSVTTIGIPIGMAVIIFAFVLTGIYTKRANSEFDDLNNKIKDSVKES
ncbi:MAG: DUF485 domain-containing protein [Sulfurimonas sp.]|jgi:uncharacterized membrane protein (DUF485 family)